MSFTKAKLQNFGDILRVVADQCSPEEVVIHDEKGTPFAARELLQRLGRREQAAPFAEALGPREHVIILYVPSLFGCREKRYALVWSDKRQGFAFEGSRVHYFISPDYWKGDSPIAPPGALVSLCKRDVFHNTRPLLKTYIDDPRMCEKCARHIRQNWEDEGMIESSEACA